MKIPICKICGKNFTKYNSLQKVCSNKCQKELDKQKRVKVKEQKKMSVSVLTKIADKIVSEYTRKRDAIKTTGGLDYIRCITCGEKKEYSKFDAGHFISRSNRSTRWQEQNINAQCKVCNCWGGGRQYEHGIAIDKKYGKGTADTLIKLGHETQKVNQEFLLKIIEEYKEKLNNLNS